MAQEKKSENGEKAIRLPIEFRMSDNIISRFASNIVVQTIENEFKVSFFEIKPEIRLGPSKDMPQKVFADCVASIIITVERMPAFIGALQTQLDKFKKTRQKREAGETEAGKLD